MAWRELLDSSAALLVSAVLLDLAVGDPRSLPHPVVLMGKLIAWAERALRSGEPRRDFIAGMVLTLTLVGLSGAAAWVLVSLFSLLPLWLSFLATLGLASTTLAARGLLSALCRIETPLREGNLFEAQKQLSHIVGRETHSLDRDKVLRAGLESLAENTSDGIVAPLFYLSLGGIPAAMAYKAINTLDSMIGYRNERYLYFGRFAARLDDVVNFIPARLTALFMVLAAYLMRLDGAQALRVVRRDHGNHPSPNAGYPEAALAGAFGIRLGGPSSYLGQLVSKPYIGEEKTPVDIRMLKEARWLCLVTTLLSLMTFLLLLRTIA
ncbi:MAG: cobalamin biosynthesis protein CobD [Elusimicrobia bacterium RIFCSPLOWO2_12_FULL_59_9]|nr:MAG: cobalamin biosynthesis protein CobD [Elusimicrobia bacterium RIFCSPLOWO2_12_FULL_59_9]